MKKVFIIHGWEGYPEEGWRPWISGELTGLGYQVFIPSMPDTKHPRMDAWVSSIDSLVGKPDENCYFIGHSLGCVAILRYIESLSEGLRVGGVLMIAGFTDNLGHQELNSFFESSIHWDVINGRCSNFVALHSDDDPYVSLEYGKVFKDKINAKLVIAHGMKHFSGDDGIVQLPIALELVKENF